MFQHRRLQVGYLETGTLEDLPKICGDKLEVDNSTPSWKGRATKY